MIAITNLFEESAKRYPQNAFLFEKKRDIYQSLNYSQTKEQVYKFGAGLMSIGLNKGDRVAMLSEGRNEWVISELAILYCGAVNVPLSVKLAEPSEIQFRLEHSGAKMVIVSQNQAKKVQALINRIQGIEKIIFLDEQPKYLEGEISFYDIIRIGEAYLKENQDAFTNRWQSVLPDDHATICYTSGTTADPKGIILTHRNYTSNVEHSLSLIDVPEKFVTLLILPWDHSFAHTTGIYAMMKTGSALASVQVGKTSLESLKNIPLNIKEIKPDFLLSVPALAKNFRKNIEFGVHSKGRLVKGIFKFGLKIAYLYNGSGWDKGKGWRIILKPLYAFVDIVIFKKIRQSFGGRLKFFVGGGALLEVELQRFFYAIGLPMLQGYGLTEASPVISANSLNKIKFGSSGAVAEQIKLKICDENGEEVSTGEKGEIAIQGENVMAGYWRNQEATNQTIINNWLHTGDMGFVDQDGFLFVLGRFKSLLIADDGEKFSPEGIEEAITGNSQYIEQCMLYNNQNPYTVALVVVNSEAIKRWLGEKHHHHNENPYSNALKLVASEINEYRTGNKFGKMFPQRWLPAAIAILDAPFSEENGLLNSTLKVVRGKVIEKYKDRIKFLYTSEAKNICNVQNLDIISGLLK
jgi:long-chain acyl-CoA synthetase